MNKYCTRLLKNNDIRQATQQYTSGVVSKHLRPLSISIAENYLCANQTKGIFGFYGPVKTGKRAFAGHIAEYLLDNNIGKVSWIDIKNIEPNQVYTDKDLYSINRVIGIAKKADYIFLNNESIFDIQGFPWETLIELTKEGKKIIFTTTSPLSSVLLEEKYPDNIFLIDTGYISYKEAHEILNLTPNEYLHKPITDDNDTEEDILSAITESIATTVRDIRNPELKASLMDNLNEGYSATIANITTTLKGVAKRILTPKDVAAKNLNQKVIDCLIKSEIIEPIEIKSLYTTELTYVVKQPWIVKYFSSDEPDLQSTLLKHTILLNTVLNLPKDVSISQPLTPLASVDFSITEGNTSALYSIVVKPTVSKSDLDNITEQSIPNLLKTDITERTILYMGDTTTTVHNSIPVKLMNIEEYLLQQ